MAPKAIAFAALGLLIGCSDPITQVVVRLRSDLDPASFTHLDIEVWSDASGSQSCAADDRCRRLFTVPSAEAFPQGPANGFTEIGSFGVSPLVVEEQDPSERRFEVRVRVHALGDRQDFSTRVISSFVGDRTVFLDVYVAADCFDVMCEPDETCGVSGECVNPFVPPERLPLTPDPPPPDMPSDPREQDAGAGELDAANDATSADGGMVEDAHVTGDAALDAATPADSATPLMDSHMFWLPDAGSDGGFDAGPPIRSAVVFPYHGFRSTGPFRGVVDFMAGARPLGEMTSFDPELGNCGSGISFHPMGSELGPRRVDFEIVPPLNRAVVCLHVIGCSGTCDTMNPLTPSKRLRLNQPLCDLDANPADSEPVALSVGTDGSALYVNGAAVDLDGATAHSVACGDFDGDGADELAIGFPGDNRIRIDLPGSPAELPGNGAGIALVSADLNGDGYDDLIASGSGSSLFVAQGSSSPSTNSEVDIAGGTDGLFGRALAVSDLNGDGLVEVIVGQADADAGSDSEAIYIVEDLLGSPRVIRLSAPHTQSRFGTTVAGLDDIDGDGYGDVAVGAPGDERVYVYLGNENLDAVRAVREIVTPTVGNGFGSAVADGGPVDGGPSTLVIGAADEGPGRVYYWKWDGTTTSVERPGGASGDRFGSSISRYRWDPDTSRHVVWVSESNTGNLYRVSPELISGPVISGAGANPTRETRVAR